MKKKIVSLMLTGVLFASMSLTAFAADVTDFTATGSKEVTTDGTVNYLNTTVYEVTLPTASCFNFTVDPQGILSAVDTAKTTYTEELYPEGTAGYIVPEEEKGAYINNKSSVPIKLMVEAHVEGGENPGDPSAANLLDLDEYVLVNSGIDNNIMLTLDITNDSVFYDANGEYKPELFDDATNGKEKLIKSTTVNPYVIAITKNGAPAAGEKGTQISFALNKAEYEFKDNAGTYEYNKVANEPGDSVGMRLSGFVNTNADWEAFTGATAEKITVKTVFAFDKLSTDYELSALDGRAYATLADTDPEYYAGVEEDTDNPGTVKPITEVLEYAVGQGALEIPFSFGTGTNEVTIDPAGASGGVAVGGTPLVAGEYKVDNNVITLKITAPTVSAALDAVADPEGETVPVAIDTTDGQTTTVNVIVYPLG